MKRFVLLLTILLCVASCSRTATVHGKFDLLYPTSLQIENFNKPIVVGSKMRFFVKKTVSDKALQVDSVSIKPPSRARVVEVSGDQFVIRATKPGPFQIIVATKSGGDVVTDFVVMRAARPSGVAWQHECTEPGKPAVYPAPSDDIWIPFHMVEASGQPMVGFGRQPVTVVPKALARIKRADESEGLRLSVKTPGSGHLKSRIDGASLPIRFATLKSVDGLRPLFETLTFVGIESIGAVQPTVGGVPMCQAKMKLQADAKNAHCDVFTSDPDGKAYTDGTFRIVGKSFGVCKVDIRYTQGNDGRGVQVTLDVPVGKIPRTGDRTLPSWLAPAIALLAPISLLPLWLILFRPRREKLAR